MDVSRGLSPGHGADGRVLGIVPGPWREPTCPGDCPWVMARTDVSWGLSPGHGANRHVPGTVPGTWLLRRAPLHQHHVAPLATLLGDPLADADDAKAAALVEGDRGTVAGEDPRLDRPDALCVRAADELREQRLPDAATPRLRRHVDGVLRHAAVALAPRDGRERGPAQHGRLLARDEARRGQMRRVPFLPRGHRLLEGADVEPRFVDAGAGRPVLRPQVVDPHSSSVRLTDRRSRNRRSCVTTTRQPSYVSSAVSSSSIASRSRWFVGSSRTRQLTPVAENRARPARVRSPGERRGAGRTTSSGPSENFASSVRASAGSRPEASTKSSSRTPANRSRAWLSSPNTTAGPSRREPAASGSSPRSAAISVDLPEPFAPTIARRSPQCSSRETGPSLNAPRSTTRPASSATRPPPAATVGRSSCGRRGAPGFSPPPTRSGWFFAWLPLPRGAFAPRRSEPPVRRASFRSPPRR